MGGGGFDVEIGQMDLVRQLFDRQQQHMTAISAYVRSNCTAAGAFSGWIMSTMHGHYTDCLDGATTGLGHGAGIAGHCSDKIQLTQKTYLAIDRRAYERFAAQQKAAGVKVAAYQPPPGGGVLGPPTDGYTAPLGPAADGRVRSAWGAAGQAAGIPAGLLQKGVPGTDPTHNWNRQPYNWREEGWNWKKWGGNTTLELANNARTRVDDALAGEGQTGQQRAAARHHGLSERYDRYYDRGHSFAGPHVPDGTRYEGAADADGTIVNDKRPGSAWTQGLKDDITVATDAKEAYDTVKESFKAGHELYTAASADIHVHQVAGGPSNSGAYTWSENDKGGTW